MAGFATIGMMKAFHAFDVAKGFKFVTYASRIMMNEVLMQFRKNEHKLQKKSMETPIYSGKDNELYLADVIEDDNIDVEADAVQKTMIRKALEAAKELLSNVEQAIVYNYLLPEPKTQRKIADKFGLTQSYISRLERRAFLKLRHFLEGKLQITEERKKMMQEEKVQEKTMQETTKVEPKDEPMTNAKIIIKGSTVKEKVEYLLESYPDMSRIEMAKLIGVKTGSIYTHVYAIKKENEKRLAAKENNTQDSPASTPHETTETTIANDAPKEQDTPASKEEPKRDELAEVKKIAKDALDKMVEISKEKDELTVFLNQVQEELVATKRERDMLLQQVKKGFDTGREDRLGQLNRLLMMELLEVSAMVE